jgi:hypothetical protein
MTRRRHAFGTQRAQTCAGSLDSLDRRGWWLATTLLMWVGGARTRVPGGIGARG